MAEKPSDLNCEGAAPRCPQTAAEQAKAWFLDEVLPLEAALTRFLQRNWRNESDIDDFRQEIYAQIFQAAETKIPERRLSCSQQRQPAYRPHSPETYCAD
jgi:hypothetical protein